MSTLSGILNTGRQALLLEQLAMELIGQNTANVNTEGYSRKRLDSANSPPILRYGKWVLGGGVTTQNLGRIRDTILDKQYRNSNSTLGYWTQLEDSLGKVEQVFNEFGGAAISDYLQEYWDAWQDLANDPENLSARTNLVGRGQTLAASLNTVHGNLVEERLALDQNLVDQVSEVNQITAEIAELNLQIANAEAAGGEASDLRDRRDLLLDNLSKLVAISSHENDDGAVNVYLGGQILVQLDHAEELDASVYTADGLTLHRVAWKRNGQAIELGDGKLHATINARDESIPDSMNQLDTFATTLVQTVNSRHVAGYGLTGTNGFNFWNAGTTGAGDIAVDGMIIADPRLVATASTPDSPADNSVALLIGQLQTERILDDGNSTLAEYYSNLVSGIGTESASAKERRTTEEGAVNLIDERRMSISGVSVDEEMTHLIQVQKSYDAAAKIVTTVTAMMDTILAMGATA
jgi:flagellar hook-associated protein 1 FlgK